MNKKYESDMTPKEKRQQELENMKSMNFKQLIQHLWTYYKIWLLVFIIAIVVIQQGVHMYNKMQEVELLSVAVFDANLESSESVEKLKEDIIKSVGTGDNHEMVAIDAGLSSGEEYGALVKSGVTMATGEIDILICSEKTYDEYDSQGVFMDFKELLGENYSKYEERTENGRMDISSSQVWKAYSIVPYEPVYLGVLSTTDNQENIEKLLEFLWE